jgi:hypothetical protein
VNDQLKLRRKKMQCSALRSILVLACLLVVNDSLLGQSIQSSFSPNVHPLAVAVGDFNRDGNLDLAVTGCDDPVETVDSCQLNNRIRTFLGNGKSRFTFKGSYFVGTPVTITAGDINRDGKLDIVASRPGPGRAATLLGNGDGSFQSPIDFVPGFDPSTLAPGRAVVADFNRDGSPDVAFPIGTNDSVGLGMGDKTGNLFLSGVFFGGAGPVSAVAADFDQNGTPDLAMAAFNQNAVGLLLGSGNGYFSGPLLFNPGGFQPEIIVSADFNRDGKEDVAVANVGSGQIGILLGDGVGGFSAPLVTGGVQLSFLGSTVGTNDELLAVGDFNHDAIPDLAVLEYAKDDVLVLLGDGTGQVGHAKRYAAGKGPNVLKVADFNNDGKDDLAIADFDAGRISILLFGVEQ